MTIWTWPDTAHCYYTTCDGCICTAANLSELQYSTFFGWGGKGLSPPPTHPTSIFCQSYPKSVPTREIWWGGGGRCPSSPPKHSIHSTIMFSQVVKLIKLTSSSLAPFIWAREWGGRIPFLITYTFNSWGQSVVMWMDNSYLTHAQNHHYTCLW